MHEILVNRLGGLSLPRKSVVRLTDRPDMTLDVYRGRKTTIQYNSINTIQYNTIQYNTIQSWTKNDQIVMVCVVKSSRLSYASKSA